MLSFTRNRIITKYYYCIFIMFIKLIIILSLSYSNLAFAATPTLSLSNSGSGDSVLVFVRGDANSGVILNYYTSFAPGIQTKTLGTTDANGNYR